jgi:hypothetical protein
MEETMPDVDRRYTVAVYFDKDNPTGARVLYGRTYKALDGSYSSSYNFQIAPNTGPNEACDEYPEWTDPNTHDNVWEAFVSLNTAIDRFLYSIGPAFRRREIEAKIVALKAKREEDYHKATDEITALFEERDRL